MKFITTKIHGYLDYIVGILLIALPWFMDLDISVTPARVLIIMGLLALVYSILTKYELGVVKVIPMRFHLGLDLLSGLVLALSPWLFGFSGEIYLPHLVVGIFEILAALLTQGSAKYTREDFI